VRAKADMSQLNLPHEPTTKKWKTEKKLKSKKWICSEVSVNSLGNPMDSIHVVLPEEEKKGYAGKN